LEIGIFFIFFWIGFAVIVGVAANTRGRAGFGWFLLAILLSPLIAGLLVLALPRLERGRQIPSPQTNRPFEPEGVIRGFPYRVRQDGTIEAMTAGGLVHFRDFVQFRAATEGGDAPPSEAAPTPAGTPTPAGPCTIRVHARFNFLLKSYGIFVNNEQVGTVSNEGIFDFQLLSGLLAIQARSDAYDVSQKFITIEAKPGQTIEIEVSADWRGAVKYKRIA
jgi:hypothetical protein